MCDCCGQSPGSPKYYPQCPVIKVAPTGACFCASNMFSFEALFANNPFWCLNQKHVSNSGLGKTQPSHGVGYSKSKQIQDGGYDFPLLQ